MTLPNVPGDLNAFQAQVIMEWYTAHEALRPNTFGTTTAFITFQSFPSLIGRNSAKSGGNAIGLKASDGSRILAELTFFWLYPEDDERIKTVGRFITGKVDARLKIITQQVQAGNLTMKTARTERYLPQFLNDAAGDQPVLQSYDRFEQLKALQRQIDPDGFFKRMGGFKF
jgi:hypothetical protein